MKACLCIILMIIANMDVYGQFNSNVANYYAAINEGKINYVKKDYSAAIKNYLTAFKSMRPYRDDVDFIAYLYSLDHDTVNAVKYYQQSILDGMPVDVSVCAGYTDIKPGTKEYAMLGKSLDSLSAVFDRQSNIAFALLIKELYTNDQFARNLLDYETDSVKMDKKLWQSILVKTDTINMVALLNYIHNSDVPPAYTMSSETGKEFKFVVHHIIQYRNEGQGNAVAMSDEIRSLITKAIYNGVLPNNFLYNALDREHDLCCHTQLYGTSTPTTKATR